MSLFEDCRYTYRDTFFVFFEKKNLPTTEKIQAGLAQLGSRYELHKSTEKNGKFESLTFISPYDFSGMDIALVVGSEVQSQIKELMDEFKTMTLTGSETNKLSQLRQCDCRFDIFHFERIEDEDNDEFLDPGGLLLVLEQLSQLCSGIALDPQSQSLL